MVSGSYWAFRSSFFCPSYLFICRPLPSKCKCLLRFVAYLPTLFLCSSALKVYRLFLGLVFVLLGKRLLSSISCTPLSSFWAQISSWILDIFLIVPYLACLKLFSSNQYLLLAGFAISVPVSWLNTQVIFHFFLFQTHRNSAVEG